MKSSATVPRRLIPFFDTVYHGNGGDCTLISNQFHRQTIAHFLRRIFSIGEGFERIFSPGQPV